MFGKKENGLYKEYLRKQLQLSEEKEKETGRISYRGTANIYVGNLVQGAGATYMSYLVTSFLSERNAEVCLLDNEGSDGNLPKFNKNVHIYVRPCSKTDIYSNHYNYVVCDGQNILKLTVQEEEELKSADYKLLVCRPDKVTFKLLADYISVLPNLDGWYFLFNQVPKSEEEQLLDIMDEYNKHTYIIPCTTVHDMPKSLKKTFNLIFGKE